MQKEILVPEEFLTQEPAAEADAKSTEAAEEEKAQGAPAEGDRMVPLAALQRERERVRALKREGEECEKIVKRLLETTGLSSPRELEAKMDELSLTGYMQRKGVDKNVANIMMRQQQKMRELERQSRKSEADLQVQQLRQNPLYSDIDDVLDSVLDYAQEKGLTVKEAYNALFGEQRAEKIRALAKEAALKERMAKQEKKIPALSEAGNASEKSGEASLTPEEASWARMAGISLEDYAKYKTKQ